MSCGGAVLLVHPVLHLAAVGSGREVQIVCAVRRLESPTGTANGPKAHQYWRGQHRKELALGYKKDYRTHSLQNHL
jgi:hypothetical protein